VQYPVSSIREIEEATMSEPKIVSQEAFGVVGMLYHGKNQAGEIPAMWGRFGPHMGEIGGRVGLEAYGICWMPDEEGAFDYVAGLAVNSDRQVPEGMVYRQVQAGSFAVFPCTIPTVGQTYHHAYEEWLPASAYEYAGGADYELYPEGFGSADPNLQMFIYIPVRPKQG